MKSKMDERELLKRLDELPRELEPENDPWDRIAARLDEGQAPKSYRSASRPGRFAMSRWVPAAVAATVVLALVLNWVPETPTPTPADAPQPRQAADAPVPGLAPITAGLAGAEAEYFAAFREFKPLGESRDRLAAPTLDKIETGWSELQRVETALEQALAENPNDPFLNRRMLELRARQLGFLRQLAALDHSNWRLTI